MFLIKKYILFYHRLFQLFIFFITHPFCTMPGIYRIRTQGYKFSDFELRIKSRYLVFLYLRPFKYDTFYKFASHPPKITKGSSNPIVYGRCWLLSWLPMRAHGHIGGQEWMYLSSARWDVYFYLCGANLTLCLSLLSQ